MLITWIFKNCETSKMDMEAGGALIFQVPKFCPNFPESSETLKVKIEFNSIKI